MNGIDCSVYLRKNYSRAVEIIVDFREDAKIHPENPYLFAYPNRRGDERMLHAHANRLNKKFVMDCHSNFEPLKRPALIHATKCRIQIATTFS